MRSGICHCLALYDWIKNVTCQEFHDIAIEMFRNNQVLPNIIANEPPKSKRSSTQDYSRGAKRLDQMEGTINLIRTIDSYKQLIFGWDIEASMIESSDSKVMTFCFAENIADVYLDYFSTLAESFARLTEFTYGMCYSRSFDLGPDLFAHGMIAGLEHGPKHRRERDIVATWFREQINEKRHLKGYLRDVYPMNILSEKHLLREVDGQLLPEWIASDAARGTIRKIGIANWLWTVPNESLPNMQAILRSQGLTIVPPDPETSS